MASSLNKPTGSVCISPIWWLSKSLSLQISCSLFCRSLTFYQLTLPLPPSFPLALSFIHPPSLSPSVTESLCVLQHISLCICICMCMYVQCVSLSTSLYVLMSLCLSAHHPNPVPLLGIPTPLDKIVFQSHKCLCGGLRCSYNVQPNGHLVPEFRFRVLEFRPGYEWHWGRLFSEPSLHFPHLLIGMPRLNNIFFHI